MTPTPDRNEESTRTTTADATQPDTDTDDESIAESLETLRMRRYPLITHWQRTDALLKPSAENVDGIEIEDVESPDEEDLHVESGADLVISVSGGQGAVQIETEGGHQIVLNDADGSESISVEDSGGNSVEMDATTGEVSVSATEQITLDAPRIDLSAAEEVNVESTGSMNIESGGNAKMRSAGLMSVNGALLKLNGGAAPAARLGDPVTDGEIVVGSTSVLIG